MAVHRNRKALLDVAEISEFWDEAAGEAFSNQVITTINQDISKLAVAPMLSRKDEKIEKVIPGQIEYWYAYRSEYRVYYRRLGPRTIEVYRIWPSRKPPLEPDQIIPKN